MKCYISFDVEIIEDKSCDIFLKLYAIKMNEELRILDNFESIVPYSMPYLSKSINNFEEWIGNIYQCKTILFKEGAIQKFANKLKEVNYKSKIVSFPGYLNYNSIHLLKDMHIQLKIPLDTTLEEALSYYKVNFIGDKNTKMNVLYNTISLYKLYSYDKKKNEEIKNNISDRLSSDIDSIILKIEDNKNQLSSVCFSVSSEEINACPICITHKMIIEKLYFLHSFFDESIPYHKLLELICIENNLTLTDNEKEKFLLTLEKH